MSGMHTILKAHKYKIISFGLLCLLIFFLWPLYGLFAHQGKLPLSPFGWLNVPENAPHNQILTDPRYGPAANNVINLMQDRRARIKAPALSAAISIQGKLVWAGSVGWADIKNGKPATPATRFRIGSTSKAITATALARLVDRKSIDLDVPISTYYENLPNAQWNNITLRQLASHSAGLSHYKQDGVEKDWYGLYQVMALKHHYASMKEALSVFDDTSLRTAPGEKFHYSSLGTILLGAVMSEAENSPYYNIIQKEVLRPNLMQHTGIAPAGSGEKEDIATFYIREKNGEIEGRVRPWRDVDLSHRLPAGGFISTSSDLVQMGAAYFDENYLSIQTRNKFWTPQTLADGNVNHQNYALGWRRSAWKVDGVGTVDAIHHAGVSRGAQSLLMILPDHEMVIAVNTNFKADPFTDFGFLYKDIIREFLKIEGE